MLPPLVRIGLALLVFSVVGAAANLEARDVFPQQWGGPNIGGGVLQLLFYAGALTGVALVIAGFGPRRGGR